MSIVHIGSVMLVSYHNAEAKRDLCHFVYPVQRPKSEKQLSFARWTKVRWISTIFPFSSYSIFNTFDVQCKYITFYYYQFVYRTFQRAHDINGFNQIIKQSQKPIEAPFRSKTHKYLSLINVSRCFIDEYLII